VSTNPGRNVNFTLNTLKGLEPSKIVKLSSFNENIKEPSQISKAAEIPKEEIKESIV
jgi:hypothetical protein